MKNVIAYIKDKIYYIMGATIFLIILLIIISSCSNNKVDNYSKVEEKMISAAKTYYASRKNKLPKEEESSVQVTIGALIDAELMKEVIDPKNKNQTCSGYVKVKKVDDDYSYIPFLTCKGNYEPKYLTDIIKNSKLDEYGNGVYEIDGEYVYRGDDVNNYVKFNNQLWRIIKVDKDGDIKLILDHRTENENYTWESSYNVDKKERVGITSDYLNTDMRKALIKYYNDNFSIKSKTYIVNKTWCIGSINQEENFNKEKECSKLKENEYVGLMNISDYGAATLDSNCSNPLQEQCKNRNYLVSSSIISTWTMNTVEGNNYQVYFITRGNISKSTASNQHAINPVIFLSDDIIISSGKGSQNNPYSVK